jgi:hypothetical protein
MKSRVTNHIINKNVTSFKISKILSDHLKLDDDNHLDKSYPADQIVCQFSSIGSLGPNETSWLCREFLATLSSVKLSENKSFKISKPICVKFIRMNIF